MGQLCATLGVTKTQTRRAHIAPSLNPHIRIRAYHSPEPCVPYDLYLFHSQQIRMRKQDITELELEYVANVIEDYAHSVDNAQMMIGSGRRQAYAHIKRCVGCNYINRTDGYLLPTNKAFRECRAPYPWHHIGRQNLRHYANIVTVREYLRHDPRFIFMGWKSERAIRRENGLPDGYEFMGPGTASFAFAPPPTAHSQSLSPLTLHRLAAKGKRFAHRFMCLDYKLLSCTVCIASDVRVISGINASSAQYLLLG